MKYLSIILPFGVLTLGGCSTPPEPAPQQTATVRSGPEGAASGDPVETPAADSSSPTAGGAARPGAIAAAEAAVAGAAGRTAALQGSRRQDPAWLQAADVAIWNTPRFKRRFVNSYLSDTDSEPTVSRDELEVMQEVFGLLGQFNEFDDPKSSEAQAKLREAEQLVERNRGETANPLFDFTAGNIHYQREEFKEALVDYRQAKDKKDNFRRAVVKIAELEYREGNYENAIESFTTVISNWGGDGVTWGLLGMSYVRAQQFVSAEFALRQAMALAPEVAQWQVGLAITLFQQREFDRAITLFHKLIDDNPTEPKLWLEQAKAYVLKEDYENAIANYEMVERLGGSSFDSMMNLADLYSRQEMFGQAVVAYSRALDLRGSNKLDRILRAANYLARNQALDEADRLATALDALKNELEPKDRSTLDEVRARVAVARGDYDGQLAILEAAAARDPHDGNALVLLGQALAQQSREVEGKEALLETAVLRFQQAAELEGYEGEAKLRWAEALVKAGRYNEALPQLRRAAELDKRDFVQRFLESVKKAAGSQQN